jgi:glutaredoxin
MEVIIYGKAGCVNCDKTRMLCQIQSLPFQYLTVGEDITAEALHAADVAENLEEGCKA